MNWYKDFIKISARNELDIDAINICKFLFLEIKKQLVSKSLNNKTISYNIDKILEEKCMVKYNNSEVIININLDIYRGLDLSYGNFDIGGLTLDYGIKNQNIELFIKLTPRINDNDFKEMYMLMFNIVRHELQHVLDNLNEKYEHIETNYTYGNLLERIQLRSNEILSKKEIEAYVRGLMLRAKRERKSFIGIVKEYIDMAFYARSKAILMKYPIYIELKKIEDKTVSKIIEEAQKIYKKVI